jgi:hypothetical protein
VEAEADIVMPTAFVRFPQARDDGGGIGEILQPVAGLRMGEARQQRREDAEGPMPRVCTVSIARSRLSALSRQRREA